MKSMMKKTLSVIIALAMILVPMSVFAAAGDPVPVPSYEYCISSGDTVTVGAGETIYFEIGTEGIESALDFVVEGTGDFDVTVCTEDGAGAYLDGTPVSAVDGKVETTIVGFASTWYYCAFAITNNSSESVDYTCTIDFPVGAQPNPYPITLAVGGTATVTVPAYGEYYVAATLPEQNVEYQLTITGNTGFGIKEGYMPTWDNSGTYVGAIAAYWGAATVCILNNTDVEQTYTFALDNMPLGSQSNPDALPINETVTKDLVNQEYWYTWTATEDGIFKFEMNSALCADGWTYNLQHNYDVHNFSTGWGENDKNVCEVAVVAGDTILLGVSIPTYYPDLDAYEVYVPASGTLVFTTTFGDGDIGGGDIGGGDIGGGDIGGDETLTGDNYILSDEALVVGTKDYLVSPMYQYTLFMFEPTETGKYTITTTDSLIGYLGGGTFYFADPSAENVAYTSYEWECASVGQGILLGVMANTNTANITITREELDESDELEWTIYENEADVEAFEYEGDTSALVPVDFEDDVIDDAVLGEDGFYHLNTVDGPILYANLNETSLQSLVAIISNGKLSAVSYAEDGSVLEKVDYTEAVTEYINSAYVDEATGAYYYPLTADLIEMFKEVGASNEWYDGEIWVYDSADAWMFACYYVPSVVDGGNEGGNVPNPEIPNTGAEVFGVAFAMMATAAVLGATVVTTKKSKRVK